MYRFFIAFFALLSLGVTKPKLPAKARVKPTIAKHDFAMTIVIDAGHGGKDGGAPAKPKSEKDITLAIALKLGKLIKEKLPEVRIVYTRTDDTFVELYERAAIANRADASLFVSIHCNSVANANIHGTEVYVRGLKSVDENRSIVKALTERENSVIYLEKDYKKNYKIDKSGNATVNHIISSMYQEVFIKNSVNFAETVSNYTTSVAKRTNRGVSQANFVVIRATVMPAALVEVGYITNATENAFLQSESGQQKMAKAIYQGIRTYKDELEGKKKETNDPSESPEAPESASDSSENLPTHPSEQQNAGVPKDDEFYSIQLDKKRPNDDPKALRWQVVKTIVSLETSPSGEHYLTGIFTTNTDAEDRAKYYRLRGFPNAYVVHYINGVRVP